MAPQAIYQNKNCAHCGANISRPPSHFCDGSKGPLAGLVFCNRECQKAKFRGHIGCGWPGCRNQRLVEGGNFKRKQHKAYFCAAHTDAMEGAIGTRVVTGKRIEWLKDVPVGHRHITAQFYRWSVFVINGEKCAQCGVSLKLDASCHIDHKHPIWLGGLSRFSNMQPLCVGCHKTKSSLEQKLVNKKRWHGHGPNNRAMTHIEKDVLIARLRERLSSAGLPTH